jgi:hypothetical protein
MGNRRLINYFNGKVSQKNKNVADYDNFEPHSRLF